MENRFWMVLPYRLIRHLEQLQLSPAGVKPERDRRPRLICDHSWYPVNELSLPNVPRETMQFGRALQRILHSVRHANPRYGPVYLSKHDVKDGFYRIFLKLSDCPRLSIVLPRYDDEEALVAIPMSSTMGWVESPPSFCAMSETVADLSNQRFQTAPTHCPQHRLSSQAEALDRLTPLQGGEPLTTLDQRSEDQLVELAGGRLREPQWPPPGPSNRPHQRPIGATDVYVDDFIQLGQGGRRRMNTLRNHLLHAVDQVLAQPQADETHRNEAISIKKLLKGDGSWGTRKIVLGWIIDTVRQTIELPDFRRQQLVEIFADLQGKRCVSNRDWHKVLGKLRFVSLTIPGSAGLFCVLQLAQNRAKGNPIRITRHLRQHLSDFARLCASLCSQPTHLAELVPQSPSFLGTTDAAKSGMGGVSFDSRNQGDVWRVPFPEDIQAALVSEENPTGSMTNSDLEQAAILMQLEMVALQKGATYATIHTFSDNTSTIARFRKGAISSDRAPAYLCRLASLHQRVHRYCSVVSFINGPENVMADDTSRLQHLPHPVYLSHFNQRYPQDGPWQLLHPSASSISRILSALRCTSPGKAGWKQQPPPATKSLTSGAASATPAGCGTPSQMYPLTPESPTSLSLACSTAKLAKPVALSALAQWRTPSWQWATGITHLGQPDPRKVAPGSDKNDPLLADFLSALADQDSPATRAYPANLTILRAAAQILDTRHTVDGQANTHVLDLMVIGFFCLLRPAEYLYSSGKTRSQAFCLCDIHLTVDGAVLPASSLLLNDETLSRISHATLTFSDQKAGVRGEAITHRSNSDPFLCPCKALGRIALRLNRVHAPPHTPIYTYYRRGSLGHVPPTWLTNC